MKTKIWTVRNTSSVLLNSLTKRKVYLLLQTVTDLTSARTATDVASGTATGQASPSPLREALKAATLFGETQDAATEAAGGAGTG